MGLAYIEAEKLRLENDPCQHSEKEIIIKEEYKHSSNLTIIDTAGLILPTPGCKNRVLQSQASVLRPVHAKIQHNETIIVCLEDCSDWSNATTRRVVMQRNLIQMENAMKQPEFPCTSIDSCTDVIIHVI